MAKVLNLNNKDGVIISQVIMNSPAEFAGIENQDVIIEVDGKEINDSAQLKNLISSGRPNNNVDLTIMRNGKKIFLKVTLGTRPDQNNISEVYKNNDPYLKRVIQKIETLNQDLKLHNLYY